MSNARTRRLFARNLCFGSEMLHVNQRIEPVRSSVVGESSNGSRENSITIRFRFISSIRFTASKLRFNLFRMGNRQSTYSCPSASSLRR